MISAVVLTKNEEKNIIGCLESLRWCKEIIIIDDYSEDKTIKNVQMFKCSNVQKNIQIFKRHLDNDFAKQRNFGLQKAKEEWVLFVDADERVSPVLAAEIQKKVLKSKYDGYYLKRRDFFGKRWLKHGETANVKLLRLGRKNAGKWKQRVHEVWEIKGKIGMLKSPLLHYPHPTVGEFLKDIDFFSTLYAQELFVQGVKFSFFRLIFNPLGKFLLNYIWRRGFLDGTPGVIVALMMSFHSFLVRAKLYQLWKKQ